MNEAVQQLRASGLRTGRVHKESNETPKDLIIRQDPSGGTEATPGQSVDLWISTGKLPDAIVPPVAGMKTWQAALAIGFLKLRMAEQNVDSDRPRGEIVGQDPSAGAHVQQQ